MAETLEDTRSAAARCTACPLFANATQTVFGEGPAKARLMLVGEQPGDKEDLAGRPSTREIDICRVWLTAEIELVKPKVLLCLGATAARSLLGPAVKVTQLRGRKLPSNLAPVVMAAIHPSSLLRMPDEDREAAVAQFVEDLRVAGQES